MKRALYSLLWFCGMPLVLGRLLWRARRQPEYLAHLGERFGRVTPPAGPCIWLHAVSVGETRAAQPLIKTLLSTYPEHRILVTHMTPTGRATGKELFGKESRIQQAWLPYDLPWLARRFLRSVRPACGIIMETEVWPNLMRQAQVADVPMLLANARLSARSAKGYARLGGLAREAFAAFRLIAAQSAADAERLCQLAGPAGQGSVSVTGNIKYDVEISPALQALGASFRQLAGQRPVMIATSTREGEEALLFEAFARQAPAEVLLVLVPRHPQRFDDVAALAQRSGLSLQRRSDNAPIAAHTRVWLGDSMGEMAAYYAMADVSLIGGSWLPFGSQNLIESCAAGVPVMIGPSSFNFTEAAEKAIEAGAALRCADAAGGIAAALALLANTTRREAMGQAGLAFCKQHGGASARLMQLVRQLLPGTA
ncbi:lipid IV(A) 3-deoxy-D-manno-octulosonic acid transferase [Uliginosibacterium sp. H3]|uniref:3-deoxy-D-manno-octulosonic acid transferase n=1 Tax=Uliginosibacterium silvisoli TaxID=3114758 RepID=A0ABU6K0W3_9RHOO|nr:lipid IV(A) 3-deoxy-D-manno-octulosonic acid transferase [Uliginosibacterium sp. H3]